MSDRCPAVANNGGRCELPLGEHAQHQSTAGDVLHCWTDAPPASRAKRLTVRALTRRYRRGGTV